MATTVLISTFPPFPTLAFSAPSDSTLDDLYDSLSNRYPFLPSAEGLFLSPLSGGLPDGSATLNSLITPSEDENASRLISLRLVPRMLGGKGGFGSQLRAAGGRMSSQKTSNNDSCRDLSGRRLSTIKEAKKLAEYLESEPERKKAAAEAQKAKLEALERKLGIDKNGNSSGEPSTGKKRRLDDTEFIEQSREIVDNVKNAVVAGLIKKKKKVKTSPSPAADSAKDKESVTSSSKATIVPTTSEVAEKAVDGPPTFTSASALSAVGA